MPDVFLFNKNSSEQQKIIDCIDNTVALLSDDDINVHKVNTIDDYISYIELGNKLDLALIEISADNETEHASYLRARYPQVDIMLLADSSISPMKYLTPKIRANSLLLNPFNDTELRDTMRDFFSGYYEKMEQSSEKEVFSIHTENGVEYIDFGSIYYVEIREKRIYIRLRNKEYSQFSTLEKVMKVLPDYFIQCHRSYALNTKLISSVKYSENIIFMAHNISVPLSRSYKKTVKEHLSGAKI